MSFHFYAWIALLLFGFETVLLKLNSKYTINNRWLFVFIWRLFVCIFTFFTGVLYSVGIPVNWNPVIISSLFSALFLICYVYALYHVDVSVFSPLYNIRTALSPLLGIVLLGELLNGPQYFLIAVIFVAGLFVSIDERFSIHSFFQKPILVFCLAMVCLTLSTIYIQKSIAVNDYWTATVWITILTQLLLGITIPKWYKDIRTIRPKHIGSLFFVAFVGMLGILAANKAFEKNVSISTAIISIPSSMILVFLLSRIAPKLLEHHTVRVYIVRFISAGIMITAALQLSR